MDRKHIRHRPTSNKTHQGMTIQQRLEVPLTVAALADHLKTSRCKLERHFADALKMTPSQADMAIRIAHAELLLSRSARTVTQVAQDCGFVDVSHLIRVFKSARGTTPEVWRRVQAMPIRR